MLSLSAQTVPIGRPSINDTRSLRRAAPGSVRVPPGRAGSFVISAQYSGSQFGTRTSNPAFTSDAVRESIRRAPPSYPGTGSGSMTVDGAVQKTALLLLVTLAAGSWAATQVLTGASYALVAKTMPMSMVTLGAAMATYFRPNWSRVTAPLYCVGQGLVLGTMTGMAEFMYPGVAMNALTVTFGTFASLLVGYATRLIQVTDQFRDGVIMATGGVMFMYAASWLLRLVGVRLPSMLSAGPLGIAIPLVCAAIAAANLLVDFRMVESYSYSQSPKWMEWYCGFSLMVTLIWMYTQILKVLMQLAGGRRDD